MENVNLDAWKLAPTACSQNSPVLSIISSDSFVTAPDSPISAKSQRVSPISSSSPGLSPPTALPDAGLDVDTFSYLSPSQEANEQNLSPTSLDLRLNDDEVFDSSLPPNTRAHLSPTSPVLHTNEGESAPLAPPPRMREHLDLGTDLFLNDPRELPRPSKSPSIDVNTTRSVDAGLSLFSLSLSSSARPYDQFSGTARKYSSLSSSYLNWSRSPTCAHDIDDTDMENPSADPYLDSNKPSSKTAGTSSSQPSSTAAIEAESLPAHQLSKTIKSPPSQGAERKSSSSQSSSEASNTETARLHPVAVDDRYSPNPATRCVCMFPNLEYSIEGEVSAPIAQCAECGRNLKAHLSR